MNDKPKRLEDVTISVNLKPLELDEEAMCEAIKYQIQQELFEWQRTTTKIPYDDGPFKGLLGKSLRKAFASAIGVDDNGQCLLTEMEHRASGSTLDKLAALVCVERKPGESDDSLRRRWLGERAGVDPFGPGPDLPSEHEEPEVQHQTITFKSHDQWARPQEEEVVVPKDWVVTADLQLINTGLMTYHRITATPGTPFKLSEYEEPRWSFPVLPGLTPAEPAVAMATWSEPITWTTGPGKQTARKPRATWTSSGAR
jgi:hypothetical protein